MNFKYPIPIGLLLTVLLLSGCSDSLSDQEAKKLFDLHNDRYTYGLVTEAMDRGDRRAAQMAVAKRNYLKTSMEIKGCSAVDGKGQDAESFDYVMCESVLPATKSSPSSTSGLIYAKEKGSESWIFLKSVPGSH